MILIIKTGINHIIARFRDTPWHAPLPAIFHLFLYNSFGCLIQQCIFIRGHHQQRHQVFKHGATPGKKNRCGADIGKLSSQSKPTLLWKFSLGNSNKSSKPCFRSQQIIITVIFPVLFCIISNG